MTRRSATMPTIMAGIDADEHAHHFVVISQTGTVLLSAWVDNNEAARSDLSLRWPRSPLAAPSPEPLT